MNHYASIRISSASPRLCGYTTIVAIVCAAAIMQPLDVCADTLDDIKARGRLIWGGDREGGGPYTYADPDDPERLLGFEVEIADLLARELGVEQEFFQGPWDNLPSILNAGQIDVVLAGYELTPGRAGAMLATHPYYIYELVLMTRRTDERLREWEDLRIQDAPPKIGVLVGSGAEDFLEGPDWSGDVEIVPYESNTDAMREVETEKLDGTLLDLPIEVFYRQRFAELHVIGPPVGRGYYVMYVRQGDERLRDALNAALVKLMKSGELKRIYERYGMWTATQDELLPLAEGGGAATQVGATRLRGWDVIKSRGPILVKSAGMTVFLACVSMPLAMAIGLFVALGRIYGPAPLRWLTVGYIELLRGTPLMLQLVFLYFMLPEIGIRLDAWVAAIVGLAVNYSAYEAEIYRAGIQAIPRGQMEAALALGMGKGLALRRIIVPQAMRIVLPPVTNDFIALFKDTSVCSVITVIELTKQYSVQRNDTGATVELAILTGLLYLLMSVPLAHLVHRLETRMRRQSR